MPALREERRSAASGLMRLRLGMSRLGEAGYFVPARAGVGGLRAADFVLVSMSLTIDTACLENLFFG